MTTRPTPFSPYTRPIQAALDHHHIRVDWRHVEAWMRCEHATLDGLSPRAFAAAVKVAARKVAVGGEQASEALAESYGL